MILLQALKLRNFLSHEETDINFATDQKLLIDGNSGSGKSSILEAIIWCLYGEGRTNNASLVRKGSTKMSVGLALTNGIDIYHIERTINNGKHTLAIQINGVSHPLTGVRELQNWIETELTGASYLLFVNSIAYVQGGPDSFVSQNATRRKDLLLEIIKTIDFDEYYERVKTKIAAIERESAGNEQSRIIKTQWLGESEQLLAFKPEYEKAIMEAELREASLAKTREEAMVALGKVDEQLQTVQRVETERSGVQSEIARVEQVIAKTEKENEALAFGIDIDLGDKDELSAELKKVEAIIAGLNEKMAQSATVNDERVRLLSNKPVDYNYAAKAEEMNEQLSNPENHNKCSNKECPYFAEKLSKIGDYAALYAEYSQKEGTYQAELKIWQESYDALPIIDLTPLKVELSSHTATADEYKHKLERLAVREQNTKLMEQNKLNIAALKDSVILLQKKVADLDVEITTLKAQVDEVAIAKYRQAIADADAALAVIKPEKTRNQQLLGGLLDREEKIPQTKQELLELERVLATSATQVQQLNLLKDAFGSKGIKSIVIDYILPELEDKINSILSQMSEFRVVLDTQQEKVDGEGNKEGLFITIINDMGEEMPFESYSGGERLKIIVSITEALATLQRCGFRLYDEVFIGLDENALESFAKVLDNLLERFPQVVCVSHLQEIKAAFEEKLLVVKHNGISHVQ